VLIPLNTDLRLGRKPWVTWSIMLVCVVVFYFQYQSNRQYENSIRSYCKSISAPAEVDSIDILSKNSSACVYLLHAFHIQSIRGESPETIELNILNELPELSDDDSLKFRLSLNEHHARYKENAPSILDEKIMYFPRSFNPLTMISSSLAHGGFLHIIGNLIFFFAFSCAVELLVGGVVRYLLSLTAIAIGCSLFYSAFALVEGSNIPGLGLSGVVMGVIGLSAYLMPKARINTLVWFIIPITRIAIPAWFLAIWFVGFDAWDLLSQGMNQGINLVAHVSGGVVGYMIGRIYFKQRKEDIYEELHDEIDYMNSQKKSFSINSAANLNTTSRVLERQHVEHEEKKARGAYLDRLFTMVRAKQNSEAINLILADVNPLHIDSEYILELYTKVGEWKKHRAYLCIGRLLIDLYIKQQRYKDAFKIAKDCISVTKDFVLTNPRDVLLLAHEANNQGYHKLAIALLHNVSTHYTEEVDYVACGLLEAEILIVHLKMHTVANQCLEALKKTANEFELERISNLQSLVVVGE